jgi:hypothetical protein
MRLLAQVLRFLSEPKMGTVSTEATEAVAVWLRTRSDEEEMTGTHRNVENQIKKIK